MVTTTAIRPTSRLRECRSSRVAGCELLDGHWGMDHVHTAKAMPTTMAPAREYPPRMASVPICAHSAAAIQTCGRNLDESGISSGRSENNSESSGSAGDSSAARKDGVTMTAKVATMAIVQRELARMKSASGASQIAARAVRARTKESSLLVRDVTAKIKAAAMTHARETKNTRSKAEPRSSVHDR